MGSASAPNESVGFVSWEAPNESAGFVSSPLAAGANIASGAREGSGSWLAAYGTFSLDVTWVASTIPAANQRVAALYFASTLSRPSRSSA